MKSNFETWVYRGAVIILLSVLGFWARGVLTELELIRGALQGLDLSQVEQNGRIKSLEEKDVKKDQRLNYHEDRIRNMELKQIKASEIYHY